MRMTDFTVLLFEGFETLDAMGPAEIIGVLPDNFRLRMCSRYGGLIPSAQNVRVDTEPFSAIAPGGVILLPGGIGTRALVKDEAFVQAFKALALESAYTLTVCTGSPVLAMTGLLDGRKATSNKQVFSWASSVNAQVHWQHKARWVVDGKFYTSSGVTAGMDMTLGFVRDTLGREIAKTAATHIEYQWNEDKDFDPFAI
jgi:transcriptional regulator GlxA family with amidase domain